MQKTYLANWHIKSGGRTIEPNERISLDEKSAEALGAAVTLVADEPQKKPSKKDAQQ